jgi:polyphenol oxidase
MIRRSENGIHWLEFELFQGFPLLKHAVFLRHGGTSEGKYASLNLSFGVGDNPAHVKSNIHKVKELLNIADLCWSTQVHGKDLRDIDQMWNNGLTPCDGMTTLSLNKGLMIHHADCQAAIFYDPVHHALSNVHCGWRGSVLNIYSETVKKMQALYGTKPEDLYVGISPSLGPENSEFINHTIELPESFLKYQFKPLYFDFWALSREQLLQCGLKKEHIQIASINTYAHPEDFFSYRYCKLRGGNATVAILH